MAYGDDDDDQDTTTDDPFEGISRLAETDFVQPGERVERAPLLQPNPPWFMWGTSRRLTIDSTGRDPDVAASVSVQLARVAYKRPETWSFWFGARLIGSQPYVGPAFVSVLFDIAIGVGRSNFVTGPEPVPNVFPLPSPFDKVPFCKFVFSVPATQTGSEQPFKWTTQVPTPRLDDRSPEGDNSFQVIDRIPAQDIQCNATLLVLPITVPSAQLYEVEAHAYFAPRTHIRPDWLYPGSPSQGHPNVKFRGGETGGS